MHAHPTADNLVATAIAGDRVSQSKLVDAHRRQAFGVAYRALENMDDAQDVAQEALMYALVRLHDLRERTRFGSWLTSITLSLCADYRRRRGTRQLGEPLTVLDEFAEEADYAERLAIREALAHLSDTHRTTLLLHYQGGWSIPEVADLMGVPPNTVRSRLMAAKRLLRAELQLPTIVQERLMLTNTTVTSTEKMLIDAAFPGAKIISVQPDPEPWMPFSSLVRLAVNDVERDVVFRRDLDPARVGLLPVLERLGIPGPKVLTGPVDGVTLCQAPAGANLLLWALGGTPHRLNLASHHAFEAIDRLQNATADLLADPIGPTLERRTLLDELAILTDDDRWKADPWLAEGGRERKRWLEDPWFASAIERLRPALSGIDDPLVYTNYLHFFPNWVRIQPNTGPIGIEEPLGWPGDARYSQNPIVEYVSPFGHVGDPLLGLAMVWIYDCYPFVHTGFVEQLLWRRNKTRRDFGPRLALKALQMIARDQPVERPAGESIGYWDGLRAYVDQGLSWM